MLWPSVRTVPCCLCITVNYEVICNINIDEHGILFRLSSVVTSVPTFAEEARLKRGTYFLIWSCGSGRHIRDYVLGYDRNSEFGMHVLVSYVRFLPYILLYKCKGISFSSSSVQ